MVIICAERSWTFCVQSGRVAGLADGPRRQDVDGEYRADYPVGQQSATN